MADKRGSCVSRLLKLLLILIIILLILAVTAFFLVVGAPVSYPAPKFSRGDTGVMAGVITRLARSLVDQEGRVVETAELHLSQNEVQTLLNAVIRKANDHDWETIPYAAAWDDGHILMHCSVPISDTMAVNCHVQATPIVDRGKLTLIPGGGSAGHIPLPRATLDFAAKKLVQAAMRSESVRTTLSAFTSIEPGENSTLILRFDPRDVNTVVRILRAAGKDPSEGEDSGEEDDDEEEEEDLEEDGDENDAGDEDRGAL